MKPTRTLLLLTLASLLFSACQLIAYKSYQFHEHLHSLRTYTLAGTVTDSASNSLASATLAIDDKKPSALKSPRFSSTESGTTVDFTFAAPGHYPRTFRFTNDGLFELMPDTPSFPVSLLVPVSADPLHFPVALDKIENPARLLTFGASLRTTVGPKNGDKIVFFDLDRPDLHQHNAPSEATSTFPPRMSFPANALYIQVPLNPHNPNAFDSTSPPKAGEYAAPSSINLVSTSTDGGLQLIPFDDGHYLHGRPRLAPENGYSQSITLTQPKLRQLEKSHYIPFYFKAGKIYGRGVITNSYSTASHRETSDLDYVSLHLTLHIQPDGTRNVE